MMPTLLEQIYDYSSNIKTALYELPQLPSVLRSFKEYQLSSKLLDIRERFVEMLQQPYVNESTRINLAGIETCSFYYGIELPTKDNLPSTVNTAYYLTDNVLYYVHREPDNSLTISQINDDSEQLTILKQELTSKEFNLKENEQFRVVEKQLTTKHKTIIKEIFEHTTELESLPCAFYLINTPPRIEDIPQDIEHAYFLSNDHLFYFCRSIDFIEQIDQTSEEIEQLKQQFLSEKIAPANIVTNQPVYQCLSREQKDVITSLTGHVNKEIEPFANFKQQPKQIIQLKEVINALWHAQKAFEDLENLDNFNVTPSKKDLSILYNRVISHSYQASYLLTHLDFNFVSMFEKEINEILTLMLSSQQELTTEDNPELNKDNPEDRSEENDGVFSKLVTGVSTAREKLIDAWKSEEPSELATIINTEDLSVFNLGKITGTVVDQLDPKKESVDFDFITDLGGVLPKKIQDITNYCIKQLQNEKTILEYSTPIKETFDNAKVKELRNYAQELVSAIDNLQDNKAFLTFKGTKSLIMILHHITIISSNILEQTNYMSEASQDIIREQLALLKYTYLPQLFALTDQMENEFLLTPGTLSLPIRNKIIPLYTLLTRYASNLVNFSERGEELLTLENVRFIENRLKPTRQRLNQSNKKLFISAEIKEASKTFFKIIEKSDYAGNHIASFSAVDKEALKESFFYLQPYLEKLDLTLSNEIVKELLTGNNSSWNEYIPFTKTPPHKAHVDNILNIKNKLLDSITSDINTHKFDKKLNKKMIESVYKHANIELCTYSDLKTNTILCDEIDLLKLTPTVTDEATNNVEFTIVNNKFKIINDTAGLSWKKSFDLYIHYREQKHKIKFAQESFDKFLALLENSPTTPLHLFSTELKIELRNLYLIFQPYFIQTYHNESTNESGEILFDINMVRSLQINSSKAPSEFYNYDTFTKPRSKTNNPTIKEHFKAELASSFNFYKERYKDYKALTTEKISHREKPLEINEELSKRASYVLKSTQLSTIVKKFKEKFVPEITSRLNKNVLNKLEHLPKQVPFPEVETPNLVLAEEKQVINIKRLYNAIYHLEEIFQALEELKDDSYESVYVSYLLVAYKHIDALIDLTYKFKDDPYMSLVSSEFLTKIKHSYNSLVSEVEPYIEDTSTAFGSNNGIKINALWYPMHAFMLIPEHIHALKREYPFTPEELDTVRAQTKKTVLTIEKIIDDSNSYFKLLLHAPTMYGLFQDLKQRLAEFAKISYENIDSNLDNLNKDIFARILMETDKWEDELGLKAGTLSEPIKKVLDEFYKGLLNNLGLVSERHIGYVCSLDVYDQRKSANQDRYQQAKKNQQKIQEQKIKLNKLNSAIKNYVFYKSLPAYFTDPYKEIIISMYEDFELILEENNTIYKPPLTSSHYVDVLINEHQNSAIENLPKIVEVILQHVRNQPVDNKDNIDKLIKLQFLINKYQTLKGRLLFPLDKELIEQTELELIERYQELEPLIKKFAHLYVPSKSSASLIDELINQDFPEKKVKNIAAMVDTVCHHFEGLDKSYQLEIDIMRDKSNYLVQQKEAQLRLNEEFVANYIKETFYEQCDFITAQPTLLIDFDLEYAKKLNEFLHGFEQEITQSCLTNPPIPDIKQHIEERLNIKTTEFETTNLKQYAQLDNVLSALKEFKTYLRYNHKKIKKDEWTIYESKNTLPNKLRHIQELKKLAQDNSISPEQRIIKLREHINSPLFKRIILKEKPANLLTSVWFVRCVISLLQALHLYTPSHVKNYHRLEDSISEKPKLKYNRHEFGFFPSSEKKPLPAPLAAAAEEPPAEIPLQPTL